MLSRQQEDVIDIKNLEKWEQLILSRWLMMQNIWNVCGKSEMHRLHYRKSWTILSMIIRSLIIH